jgi:hypothetical protein
MTSPLRQDRRVQAAGPVPGVPRARPGRPAGGGAGRLSRVIAPLLREHGLTVTPYPAGAGEPRELVVTNPAFPGWGRVVIDREGFMEWDLQATVETDDGARQIAGVITGILASGQGEAGDRYGRPPHWQPPEDAERPHP